VCGIIRERSSLIYTTCIKQEAGARAYARAPGLQIALLTLLRAKLEINSEAISREREKV
jgi:hypothetical protein